jgi:OHCU decarboxylase
MRFATPQGFNAGDQFYTYLKDSFDVLYREGETAPKLMSVGLHCRIVGRPGRAAALGRFLDHVASQERVWVARRIDVARHWIRHHRPADLRPSGTSRALAAELWGDVFEHSPWVAAEAQAAGLSPAQDSAEGLHAAMAAVVDAAPRERQLALLNAHPDLAGRLRLAELTEDSATEQASAGLDQVSEAERERFLALNDAYRARFGFPFIMAVKGRGKAEILAAFERRLEHEAEEEFATALAEVKTIALLRLKERLPSLSDAFAHTA